MKVLVTGASGFVGQPVVQSLLLNGHSVLAISRKMQDESKLHSMKWLHADLTEPETYHREILKFSPEAIIHLAWDGIPDFSYEASILNLKSSLDLLSFTASIASCSKIIVSGSCMELKGLQGKCPETETGAPKDHFTWSKHSLRTWIEVECIKKNIHFCWLRIFYVYGPRQRDESLVPSIINHLKNEQLPLIRTPLDANDYVYVDDVANAFVQAVSKNFKSGIFNIGSGESTSVLEVCRKTESILNNSEKLTQQLERTANNMKCKSDFWADISDSRNELGWSPVTSLDEGIYLTYKWMESK